MALSKKDKAIARSLINSLVVAQKMLSEATNNENKKLWADSLGQSQLALNELLGIELPATDCYNCNPALVKAAKFELESRRSRYK